jgi:hypothetical protein
MSATATVSSRVDLAGLGKDVYLPHVAVDGTTPTEASYQYRILATADTAEALGLGGVSTVQGVMIRAIDYDLDVDTSFVSTFSVEQTAKAGEPALIIMNPSGTLYVKNNGASETPAFEYVVWGT